MLSWLQSLNTSGVEYMLLLIAAAGLYFTSLEKRPHFLPRLVAGALPLLVLGLLVPNDAPFVSVSLAVTVVWYCVAYLLVSLLALLTCRISFREALACGIFGIFTEHISSSLYILVSALQGKVFQLRYQQILIYILVYALLWFAVARRMPNAERHYSIAWPNIIITAVFGNFVTVVLSMMVKSNVDPDLTYHIMDTHIGQLFYAGQLYAIAFCVTMLIVQYTAQRQIATQQELAATEALWQLRQKQYEQSRENIDLINRKCHDMKHQVAALLAQGDDTPERKRYIREIEQTVEVYESSADSGNEVLNTLLMEKGLFCSMNGIQWVCAADGRGLEFVDTLDLYTMLGNALDNAVEAVMKLPDPKQRIIQMSVRRRGRFSELRIENSFAGTLTFRDGLPETSKGDSFSHGIGLKSIRAIAEKYGGSASVAVDGQAFILSIMIPLREGGNDASAER